MSLPKSAERFLSVLKWLLNDVFENRMGRFVLLILVNVVGVATSTAAFTLLVAYVRFQSSGGPSKSFHGVLRFMAPVLSNRVTGFGICIFILGVFSALCLYLAQHLTLRIVHDYHKNAVAQATAFITTVKIDRLNVSLLASRHQYRHLTTLYARYTANFLRLLFESILPLATSLFAFSVLFYLDIRITLSLIPFGVFYGAYFFHLTQQAATTLKNYQSDTSEAGPFMNGTVAALKDSSNPLLFHTIMRHVHKNSAFSNTLEGLYEQTRLSRKITFVNRVFQIAMMAWIIIAFGHTQGKGSAAWVSILAFLIALRYAWQSLMKLSTLSMEIGKIFPVVEVFSRFIRAGEHVESPGKILLNEIAPEEKISIHAKDGGETQLLYQWKKDRLLLILTPEKMTDTHILECLTPCLTHQEKSYYRHGTSNLIPGLTILQNAIGDIREENTISCLKRLWDFLGILDQILSLPDGMETYFTPEIARLLTPDTRFAISSTYCLLFPRFLLLLNARNFLQLTSDFQKKFLERLKESFVALTFDNLAEISRLKQKSRTVIEETMPVAVINEKGLIRIEPLRCFNVGR